MWDTDLNQRVSAWKFKTKKTSNHCSKSLSRSFYCLYVKYIYPNRFSISPTPRPSIVIAYVQLVRPALEFFNAASRVQTNDFLYTTFWLLLSFDNLFYICETSFILSAHSSIFIIYVERVAFIILNGRNSCCACCVLDRVVLNGDFVKNIFSFVVKFFMSFFGNKLCLQAIAFK